MSSLNKNPAVKSAVGGVSVVNRGFLDIGKYPMNQEAFRLWKDPNGLATGVAISSYLHMGELRALALIFNRQIEVGDFDFIIGLDGEPAECFLSGRTFQPVWWIHISAKLQKDLWNGITAEQLLMLRSGHFFVDNVDKEGEELLGVSGHPIVYGGAGDNPMVSLHKRREEEGDYRWGMPRYKAQMILSRRTSLRILRESQEGLAQKINLLTAKRRCPKITRTA